MWISLILSISLAFNYSFALSPIQQLKQIQNQIKKYQKQSHTIQHFQQLRSTMTETCSLTINQSNSFFVFQTPRGAYFAINQDKGLHFYSFDCSQISMISHVVATHLICDRSLCDDGSVVIATKNGEILVCEQRNVFKNCTIVFENRSGHIWDIIVRSKLKAKPIIYLTISSDIKTYPTQITAIHTSDGVSKSIQMQTGSQITHMVDLHPYPIVISHKGWIYHFHYDTQKLEISTCPHPMHQIKLALTNHPYHHTVYLISDHQITALEVKPKMKCKRLKHIYCEEINLSTLKTQNVDEIENHIYVGGQVIGIEDGKVEQVKVCKNNFEINFLLMKNKFRKGEIASMCCTSINQNCTFTILTTHPQQLQSKSNIPVILIPVFMILTIIICFIKKLRYPSNHSIKTKTQKQSAYENEVSRYLKNRALQRS